MKNPAMSSLSRIARVATFSVLAMCATVPAWSETLAAPAAPFAIEQIAGTWEVVGVQVAGGPIQALVANDPSYMGRRLSISPTRLAWAPKGSARGESCDTPTVLVVDGGLDKALGDAPPAEMSAELRKAPAYVVACREKDWGPASGAMLAYPQPGQLVLTWYDNAVLLLRPVEAAK